MVSHLGGLLLLVACFGSGYSNDLPPPSEDLRYTQCKDTSDSVHNYAHYDLKTNVSESMDQYDGKILLLLNVATFWGKLSYYKGIKPIFC